MGNLCTSPEVLLEQFKQKPIGEEVRKFRALETKASTPVSTHVDELGASKKRNLRGFEYTSQKFIAIRP